MKLFQHPETGEHVHASPKTAERLIEEGWHEATQSAYAPAAETSSSPPVPLAPPAPPAPLAPAPPAIEPPEKPLEQMGMPELVAYAEKIGMPDADKLRKPGNSKVKAKDAIEAYIASQQQQ